MDNGRTRGGWITGFDLKIIAIVAMLIDHIGALFFPNILLLRIIGRLTMPIMCFFIAEGYRHTHSVEKYIGRMLVFAFVSQIPFMLAFGYTPTSTSLNVMFTFVLGLLALTALDRIGNVWVRWMAIAAIAYAGYMCNVDYHDIGVLMVLAFGLGRGRKGRMVLLFCAFVVAFVFLPSAYSLLDMMRSVTGFDFLDPSTYASVVKPLESMIAGNPSMIAWRFIQTFCILAAPLLALYNGKRGGNMRRAAEEKPSWGAKYLFYIFYPAHLLVLYVIRLLI